MAFFEWYDSYSIHIEKIDSQHKKLIEMINNLHDATQRGKAFEQTGLVLKELVSYTKYHFTDEENIMQQFKYPEFKNHQKAHLEITKKLILILKKLQNNEDVSTYEILNFMRD